MSELLEVWTTCLEREKHNDCFCLWPVVNDCWLALPQAVHPGETSSQTHLPFSHRKQLNIPRPPNSWMVAELHSAETTLVQLPHPLPPAHLGTKANGERKGVLHPHCWGRLGRQSLEAENQPKPQTYGSVLRGPFPAGKAPKAPLPSCQ